MYKEILIFFCLVTVILGSLQRNSIQARPLSNKNSSDHARSSKTGEFFKCLKFSMIADRDLHERLSADSDGAHAKLVSTFKAVKEGISEEAV
jgi:hypothetical protein